MSKSKNKIPPNPPLSKGGKRGFPVIGITLGDPQGIGPEVIQKALRSTAVRRICRPIVFGDAAWFNFHQAKKLTPKQCGQLSAFYIEQATHAALQKEIGAIVTAPICKERLQMAGYPFPGHTEFLAALTKTKKVRMLMAGPSLKVVLVTIHEPFRSIATSLTRASILETIRITDQSFRQWFRIRKARIAVAALNPHAGEGGIFGSEERKIITPAIKAAQKLGIRASGPYPPDTVYRRAVRGEFDVVVSLYHDQGLIPLKLLHFEEAVNMTLGLPIIRTSVDHGTAFDIAGKEVADPTSMIAAIKMAAALTHR